MQEDNSSFSLLLDLLSELYQKQPKIGYHLLYYLRARWVWAPPVGGQGAPRPASPAELPPPSALVTGPSTRALSPQLRCARCRGLQSVQRCTAVAAAP